MKIETKSQAQEIKKPFEVVPEGKYTAKISRVQEKISESTGTKYVQVAFEILNSKKHSQGGNAVFENFLIDHPNENALHVSQQRSEKVGKALLLEILEPSDLLTSGILDKELIIHVKNKKKEYNGEERTYANVSKFEEAA